MDMISFALGLKKGAAGNLRTQEKTIEITEPGTYEITPDIGFALSKVLMKVNVPTGGGGSVPTTEFLTDTSFTNEYMPDIGAFAYFIPIETSAMEAWMSNAQDVTVVYDGMEYKLTPQIVTGADGNDGVCVGDLTAFGGTGNGEPFAVVPWFVEGLPCFLVGSTVDTTATEHTIRIYQEASGSGDEWVVATGKIEPMVNDPVTINHDLGVVPDIVYVVTALAGPLPTGGENKQHLISGCLISEKLLGSAAEELDDFFGYSFMCNGLTGGVISGSSTFGLENMGNNSFSCVCNVTSETMRIGTNYVGLLPGNTYRWVAIARK